MSQGSSFSQYQISTKREARASKIVAMISDYQIKRLTNLIWKLVVTFSFVLQVKLTGHYHSLTVLTKSQGASANGSATFIDVGQFFCRLPKWF